jgi:hypothetical protein
MLIDNLIHVGKRGDNWVFLRKLSPVHYVWMQWQEGRNESETDISALNAEEALRLAHRNWNGEGFVTLNCGFRYTLPERDEHGSNALFYQMVASYSSPSGVYFDEELGGNCIVHNASAEARKLWNQLKAP